MTRVIPLVCVLLGVMSGAAYAAPTPKPRCWSRPTSQVQMGNCAYLWFTRTEARLRLALKAESSEVGISESLLEKSQAAWMRYRDAECRLQAGVYRGGSVYNLVYLTCEGTLTDGRTAEVRAVIAGLPH